MRRQFALSCGTLALVTCFVSIAQAQAAADAGAPAPSEPAPPGAAPPGAAAPGAPGTTPPAPAPGAPPAGTGSAPAAAGQEQPAEAPPASPPPAAPESPPVTTAAPSTPPIQPVMPAVAPPAGGDKGAGAKAETTRPPPEMTLGFEFDAGLATRLGDASDYGFYERESAGLSLGPSVWFSGSRLWSIGLAYQRTGMGSDRSDPAQGTLSVRRSLDTLWLGGRAYPWRTDQMGLFLGLGLGMSWQRASAAGARETQSFVKPAESYSCSASDGPGFALGGGLGFDLDLARDLAFITQLDAAGHRHTSDVIGGCARGSGTVTSLAARVGFAYRFDLDPGSTHNAARAARR